MIDAGGTMMVVHQAPACLLRLRVQTGASVVVRQTGVVQGAAQPLGAEAVGGGLVCWPASEADSELLLAPALPSAIEILELDGGLLVQDAAFLAAAGAVGVEAAWPGAASFYGDPGLRLLRLRGQGLVAVALCGGRLDVTPEVGLAFETGVVAAFSEGLGWRVRPEAGLRTAGGPSGLLCEFAAGAAGEVMLQARSPGAWSRALSALRGKP